jgi:Replication-relaxation
MPLFIEKVNNDEIIHSQQKAVIGMARKDRALISFIGKFGILSVKQLSTLSQRSDQLIRRDVRELLDQRTLLARQRSFGQKKGRPENLFFLSNKGWKIFYEKYDVSNLNLSHLEKAMGSIFIEHDLLLNWVLIHLIQIEREIINLSVKYLTQNLVTLKSNVGGRNEIAERISIKGSNQGFLDFVPDAVITIKNSALNKSLLFFLEVDMGTETIASPRRDQNDIRQKIINYQGYFRAGQYKRYEKIFSSQFNGFRLLFLTNSSSRLTSLCRLVREMPPSDFVWLTDQERMFSNGLSAKIWSRGGIDKKSPHSILGNKLACKIPVVGNIKPASKK